MRYGCRQPAASFFRDDRRFRRFSSSPDGHMLFIKEVAGTSPPEYLPCLLKMLQARGDSIVHPEDRRGVIPLAIPLCRNKSGAMTALLRWPTAPAWMAMPVVEVQKHGVWLLSRNVDQYIHRLLVEEDAALSEQFDTPLYDASAETGAKIYKKGSISNSDGLNLYSYLLRNVGLFPDVLECKIMQCLDQGDHVSALATGEFYIRKEHFPGFGRPSAFNAEVFMKIGRNLEAKDAARGALKSPWWTLGRKYQEVAEIAQWENEQIESVKSKVSDKGKEADLIKGKDPVQIALDEAALLLNLASLDGTWEEYLPRVADCYIEAGLRDVAKFISYSVIGWFLCQWY